MSKNNHVFTTSDSFSRSSILIISHEDEALPFLNQDGTMPKGIQILRDSRNPSKMQRERMQEKARIESEFNKVSIPPNYVYKFDPSDIIIPA